ncbi:MAG: acyl-CoA dehydrogenase family protein [Pseudomonadales bacterium]|nr:acyl-CoA dehydrogenase family protein [Pseudomonadales bacterium]
MTIANDVMNRLFEISHQSVSDLSITQWKALFDDERVIWQQSIDQALLGGALADRTAFAFSSGYLSALRLMFPDFLHDGFASLCVTEEEGNHPKAIKTTLKNRDGQWLLNGLKTFVTGGCDAEQLFIAATTDEVVDGRPQIRVVRVLVGQQGMVVTELPTLPFVPEVSHATVRFDNAQIDASDILSGDGYSDYVKLFRTIEDIHVSTAILGYIARTAIFYRWPERVVEQILALIISHRQLGLMDARCSMTHLALAGARQQMDMLLEKVDVEWEKSDKNGYECWLRDKALLKIAGKAGSQRRENAWTAIGSRQRY